MNAPVTIRVNDASGGQTEISGDRVQFSTYRCFPLTGAPTEIELARRVIGAGISQSKGVGLYPAGPVRDFLRQHVPALEGAIDIADLSAIPPGIDTLVLCETRAEALRQMRRRAPGLVRLVSLADARFLGKDLPADAWISAEPHIYPIDLPDIKIAPDLDVLILDLPARAGEQIPVGIAYVHAALARSTARFQTVDVNMLWYHRFQAHRLLDLGVEPILRNGVKLNGDSWDYSERIWVDPRQWPFLLDYFAEEADALLAQVLAARPKIVGFSVHQRNEWITRDFARKLKQAAPEIIILAGGHSCYSDHFGKGAFPEYDYMVIGEADMVVGPLVEQLARGERPANVAGVVSKFDDPNVPFRPGPMAHNLDMLGGLTLDWFDDPNTIYQTWSGYRSTALPLTRGCVWSRCSFCAERFSFRTRSATHYVDEMERIMLSGRPGVFSASDSDFGGRPETLYEICEEILRRDLKVSFSGQIRLNKKFDLAFFTMMKAAGVTGLNFGADAFTENTIRRQMKGYTLETLLNNHRDCMAAGIEPAINIVVGAPGETDQDIVETIRVLSENIDCFPVVNNINTCLLVQNSVYWFEPERFNIHFYGDKAALYEKYYFGIPSRLWYSLDPFIDKTVRADRFFQLVNGLQATDIRVGPEILGNLKDLIAGGGHMDYREMTLDGYVAMDPRHLALPPRPALPAPPARLHLRIGDDVLAFAPDPAMERLLRDMGAEPWLAQPMLAS
jgi:hypothetical protein